MYRFKLFLVVLSLLLVAEETMSSVLSWVKTYWYIPVFVLVAILVWVFTRRKTPIEQTKAELTAIQAGIRAKEWESKLGAEQARKQVEETYQVALLSLSEKQKIQAKELENDPEALAKFLVKTGSSH